MFSPSILRPIFPATRERKNETRLSRLRVADSTSTLLFPPRLKCDYSSGTGNRQRFQETKRRRMVCKVRLVSLIISDYLSSGSDVIMLRTSAYLLTGAAVRYSFFSCSLTTNSRFPCNHRHSQFGEGHTGILARSGCSSQRLQHLWFATALLFSSLLSSSAVLLTNSLGV